MGDILENTNRNVKGNALDPADFWNLFRQIVFAEGIAENHADWYVAEGTLVTC